MTSRVRAMRRAAHRWERVREQLEMDEPHVPGEGVHAYCPACGAFIGHWPEGGKVDPPELWTGKFVCACGWKPVLGENTGTGYTGVRPGE